MNSIKINPDDAYTLNYLAYSWLERNYRIDEAIEMIQKAYNKKENDPYITDSVGWGYYLIGDYEKSITDINYTLILEPRHFGAMDGLALIFIESKKYSQALEIYREIQKILPYSKDIESKIKILDEIISKNI